MSIIEADTLHAWLAKGDPQPSSLQAKSPIKLLFTTMPGGTAAKHATLHHGQKNNLENSTVQNNVQNSVQNSYIENSITFDFQTQFADPHSTLSNTMCSPAQFQMQAQALGLNNHDTLVVYDNYGNFCASRVWFMCKAMGIENVYVLNGGLPKWISLGYGVVNGVPKSTTLVDENDKGNFQVKVNPDFCFIGQNEVSAIVAKQTDSAKASCIVDARSGARFRGESPDPRPNIRSGHIPTSVNMYYGDLQDEWGSFLPLDVLRDKFSAANLLSHQLVFTCGSGVTACILAQAAHMLGLSPLKVYDGSWSQWGADASLEIATGLD